MRQYLHIFGDFVRGPPDTRQIIFFQFLIMGEGIIHLTLAIYNIYHNKCFIPGRTQLVCRSPFTIHSNAVQWNLTLRSPH